MSRSFKNENPQDGKSNGNFGIKPAPKAIIIVIEGKEVLIKKELISGFGYKNGSNKQVPLNKETFHQVINNELTRKQKGRDPIKEIYLLGPNPVLMGKNNAGTLEEIMRQHKLKKGASYEVKEIVKEGQSIARKKMQLQDC